ncbi:MAG: hypothetical protein YSLV5_ORF07 [Yellowstone Lake virophage 5]|uniref:Endonuclease n=1 Tax=Yellowstone Lake virophage 5 TaxID=1557033 RepID=A0A0A0RL22_9VIRU|nr:MAG: hypothetical protein ASQ69_gp07 [Yellowstone Lake virophage 5]AIW01865.1 MAG: hypothetical protein YSLV5_ORF07 [Yellowstone Lake virophage 5]
MASLYSDLAMGDANEQECHRALENYSGCRLIKRGKYDTMDFASDNEDVYMELKSRRIRHNQYPTAIIGGNKIDFCQTFHNVTAPNPPKCIFAFCYTDGLYAIEYKPELFAQFERRGDYWRGTRAGIANRAQDVVFIPVEHLVKINNSET